MHQFISPLTEPIGTLWTSMVLGVLWLLARRHWRSAFWLGLPTLVLFVIGSTPLAETLVANEERRWAGSSDFGNSEFGIRNSELVYDAVVALGGGERVSPCDLLGFAESDGGSRLLTAIQLVRLGKARTLVLGGSWPMPGHPNVPSMNVVEDWVANWGLVSGLVTNLGICINTHDEAMACAKLAQSQHWTNLLLVTSALHLRRGVALFKKQGMDVTPVAADFEALGVPQEPFSPFPRQHRLFLLALYFHEKFGWWAYRARGWVE